MESGKQLSLLSFLQMLHYFQPTFSTKLEKFAENFLEFYRVQFKEI